MPTAQTAGPPADLSPARRALLEARLWGRNPTTAIPRRAAGEAPLSFAQERLWFLDRLRQGGSAYNITSALRLSGPLDAAALERAVGGVVRRHEALRTVFREAEGVPAQVVTPFTGFALPVEPLEAVPGPEREGAALRAAAGEAARPFDLTAGPLFRARLLRLAEEEHVLLLAMHHIVSDGWSLQVIFRELWALYAAFQEGLPTPLPEPVLQYADYAAWQRERPAEAAARHLAEWREALAGAPEVLELPTDHPRPPVPSFRGARVPVSVPPRTTGRLRAVAQEEGATPFMVVLAAFAVLLSRYAGTGDVVVGTPVAGRTRRETQEMVGLFMNTLVLRADLSGEPTFRALVGRVRETVLGAYERQELPFETLVAELRPERSLSHAALFQVLFQLDTAGEAAGGGTGLRVRALEPERETTKLDLTLDLDMGAGGIGGVLEYSTDLFERGTARRMVEHLERILEQVAEDPGRRVSRLELMGRAERARVVEWNRTTARYPAARCIHHLFEEQAARTPGATAVAYEGGSLTFGELEARANRLARHLARRGVGPEDRVALCLERGAELLPAILGVMKAGGAWVPLDRAYPAERLRYMLEDSGARLLLTQERLRGVVPLPEGVGVVALDAEWERIAAEPAEAMETAVTSENLAYVIYTSGSTGRPKGVAMHHRGVCNYIHWGIRAYGAGEGSGAPVFSSIAVDLTLTNLLPLFAGRPVRLLSEASPVEALAEALRARPGFGLVKITPIHLSLLTPLLTPEEAREAARTLVVGADFLTAEPTGFWQEHAPGVRLMNEYGPTETVVGCSAYLLPPGKHRAGPVPVGHPIQNLRFYVLDGRGEPVPVGLPGELYIGGAGVARGYLGRAALTAEKFVPDPFAEPGARMYRTGDRARWQDDGNLMILGRTDAQVKIRGYRVELGEVEAALRKVEGIREVLCMVREDRPGDRRLVAYVAGARGADPGALREHLLRTLPEYMVPAAFVGLDAFPQTSTGKIDRATLPAPAYGPAAPAACEPRDEVESELLETWEELLGIDGVGPTDNFFELGGNSFLALRLFALVNRRLECDLPLATLFADATVGHMAEAIREQRRAVSGGTGAVVVLQGEGALPPLFVVHSSDRNVMGYVNLVRHLGAGQPVFGLRDVGEDMARPIPRIAAGHVEAIRAVRPRGPYALAGWSFGGFVAFEMAAQLARAGEEVAFVGLLDTMSPALAQRWPESGPIDMAIGLAHETADRMGRPFSIARAELEGLGFDAQLRRIVEALHARGAAPPEFGLEALREGCEALRDRRKSLAAYRPEPSRVPLTLFQAAGVPEAYGPFLAPYDGEERRTLGWCALSSAPVTVHTVPGSHATLASEPHVRELAERMREALARARSATGTSTDAQSFGGEKNGVVGRGVDPPYLRQEQVPDV